MSSPKDDLLEEIKRLFIELSDLQVIIEKVKIALNRYDPLTIIEKALKPAMDEIGRLYEAGEYFLPELILASDMFKKIMDTLLKPAIYSGKESPRKLGRVVIGTVEGDIHDIGKNIVAALLEVAGFEVIDLGVDVPVEKFIEAVKKYNPDILAMSALLTTTKENMRKVIEALKREGLRDKVKVIIGGAAVSEDYAREIGADAYGSTASDGVRKCKMLVNAK
ncbi:MAG TPA: cobalamin-binding protein [Desulfurococcales archaeon]|nr:cobalamin-binding protein [Desulfurococcales archaeon]